jgi:hypothetical protein
MKRDEIWLCAAALGWLAACGPKLAERSCSTEQWTGSCRLSSISRLQEKEFPVPHVLMEAIYSPQQNPQHPSFTPGEARKYFKVLSNQELALRDHLERHREVQCHLVPPQSGICTPGEVALLLPEFDALGASAEQTLPKPAGCAQIESQETQEQARQVGSARSTIPEEIQFERGSAAPPPDTPSLVNQLAQRIRANPQLECVAVVGQVAPGETQGLADQRARAIKNMLLENGVDPARLMIITTTVPVFGAGSGPPPDDPEKRRVRLRVLLESSAAPAP